MSKPLSKDPDFSHIIISALRYAMGRNTYITSLTADFIKRHWQEPPCCATCKHLVYSTKYKEHGCIQHRGFVPNPHIPACKFFTPKKSNIKH